MRLPHRLTAPSNEPLRPRGGPRSRFGRRGWPTVLALAVLLTVLAGAPARALAEWVQLGPDGGDVMALAASPAAPGLVFAGLSSGGIFRSADGGATWRPAREGLEHSVFGLVAHPTDPDTVYATTAQGVLVSHDRGASWSATNDGLPIRRGFFVFTLAIVPSTPGTLYAGTSRGVWRSLDGGGSWRRVSRGLADGVVRALAIDPRRPETLFAAVDRQGLFKSTDGGAHWSASSTGLGNAGLVATPAAIAFSAEDPSTVFALAEHPGYTGVSVSTDGGATWTPAGEDLRDVGGERRPWRPRALAVLPPGSPGGQAAEPEMVAAGRFGVFHSTDGGATWTRVTEGLSGQESAAVTALPFAAGEVLVGFQADGIFRSTDGGASWRPASDGLLSQPLSLGVTSGPGTEGLVIDPRGSGHLYAVGRNGNAFASSDWGLSWQGLQGRFHPGAGDGGIRLVRDLWLDPTRPRIVFASVQFAAQGGEPSRVLLFRSTDAGEQWTRVGAGLPVLRGAQEELVGAIHWDPRGRTTSAGPLYQRTDQTAYRSTDDGATWSVWLRRLPAPLARLAPTPQAKTLLAWDEVPGENPCKVGFCPPPPLVQVIYESFDGGTSWASLDSFHDQGPDGDRQVFVDARNPARLYTIRDGDIERSTDGGTTFSPFVVTPFEPLGARPEEGRSAGEVADPAVAGVRYRGQFDGLERSTDGGATWAPFATGILATIQVQSVVLPASGPRVLFAATQAGVWARSLDDDSYPPTSVPPPGAPMTTPEIPGFRFWVRIVPQDGEPVPTRREAACLPETLCVSGAVPGRSEVFLRVVGPKPNGYLWPTLVKLTTSAVDVWIQRASTGRLRQYHLEGAAPGHDVLPGLFDREGFPE